MPVAACRTGRGGLSSREPMLLAGCFRRPTAGQPLSSTDQLPRFSTGTAHTVRRERPDRG